MSQTWALTEVRALGKGEKASIAACLAALRRELEGRGPFVEGSQHFDGVLERGLALARGREPGLFSSGVYESTGEGSRTSSGDSPTYPVVFASSKLQIAGVLKVKEEDDKNEMFDTYLQYRQASGRETCRNCNP